MTVPSPPAPLPLLATTTCPDTAPVFDRLWRDHGPVAPVELEPGVNAWLVMGYEELKAITGTPDLYSRDARDWKAFQDGTVPPDSPLGPMMFFRDNVIGYDGETHRRLRRPSNRRSGPSTTAACAVRSRPCAPA
ncbi:hypothetical protein ACFQHO_38995 [Actinomadura yumaensis]|uniref:hypothetical protein n=1 Tax=Actinomadura yumaensis TaxID=111807 RepID=UPI00360E53CE